MGGNSTATFCSKRQYEIARMMHMTIMNMNWCRLNLAGRRIFTHWWKINYDLFPFCSLIYPFIEVLHLTWAHRFCVHFKYKVAAIWRSCKIIAMSLSFLVIVLLGGCLFVILRKEDTLSAAKAQIWNLLSSIRREEMPYWIKHLPHKH